MLTTRFGFLPLKTDDGPALPRILTRRCNPATGHHHQSSTGLDTWKTDFAAIGMRDRLDRILGQIDVGNGTAAAAALSSALKVDFRLHDRGGGSQRLLDLEDEDLVDLAARLAEALEGEGDGFSLPLGSEVLPCLSGGVRIDAEVWALDADAPGLYPEETIPFGTAGANLQLLRRELSRLIRKQPWEAVGLPSAHVVADGGIRHFLQFPPFAPAGGVVLQFAFGQGESTVFRSAVAQEISRFAHYLAADMKTFWSRRTEIAARLEAARASIDEAAALTTFPVRRIAIRELSESDPFDLEVEFDGVDDTLRPGIMTGHIPSEMDPPSLAKAPSTRNRDEAERLAALGADGTVDNIARGAIQAAPEGPAAVLARLARNFDTTITFPMGSGLLHVMIYWGAGSLRGEISLPGTIMQVGRHLTITGAQLPETVLAGLGTPRLDQMVELPFPCDATVVFAEHVPGGVRLRFELDSWLIDLASGEMWPEPH